MYKQTRNQLKNLVKNQIVPGISFALIDHDQIEQEVLGNSQLEPTIEPLVPNSLYDVASLTKVVGTTMVILQLLEAGQLKLTQPVADFLDFADPRLTILDLLTHMSGLSGYIENRDQLSAADLKQALLALTLDQGFEQQVVYRDVNFLYLGWIAEQLLGEPIQTLISKRVFASLHLTDATFDPNPTRSVPTEFNQDHILLKGKVDDPKASVLKQHAGSAGAFMTLEDLIQFSQFMLGQTKQGPISQTTIARLFHDFTPNLKRSLGWDLRLDPKDHHPALYHTGFTGTFMLIDRKKQFALIALTNRIHPTRTNNEFLVARDKIIQTAMLE